MTIEVQFFAMAKELAGSSHAQVEIPNGGTVSDLRSALAHSLPALQPILSQLFMALEESCVDDLTPLFDGAKVVCFPPVSGG